jgi:hypothetical protein
LFVKTVQLGNGTGGERVDPCARTALAQGLYLTSWFAGNARMLALTLNIVATGQSAEFSLPGNAAHSSITQRFTALLPHRLPAVSHQ